MVRALGMGVGVGTAGVSIRQAWQFIPSVYTKAMYKSPSYAKPSNRSYSYITPISAKLRVTMSLPKFSPAKILENIIFSIRFKKPDTDVDQSSSQNLGENGNLGSSNNIVDGQIAEREKLIESLQEETRKAGIVEPSESLGDRGEEITSVTKDTLNPSILWERREKDVQAERERRSFKSPGFSFSAAGLLFPYHLGVCQCLLENSYITEDTPLAGSSAGALVCAVVGGGLSMHDALQATKELALDCRTYGTAFRLGAVLRIFLEKFLPDDIHEKVNGKVRVAVTQVFRQPRGLLVDYFDSKEDLINALLTSCFIPGYLAPRPVTVFRNRICVDGGITLFMPPTVADRTVRVCAFPLYAPEGISPDLKPTPTRASMRQLFNWALEPAADEILDELFELGYQDALVWVNKQQSVQQNSNGGTNGSTSSSSQEGVSQASL